MGQMQNARHSHAITAANNNSVLLIIKGNIVHGLSYEEMEHDQTSYGV